MIDRLRALLTEATSPRTDRPGGGGDPQTDPVARAIAFLMVEAGAVDGCFDDRERARARALLTERFGATAAETLLAEGEARQAAAGDWYGPSRRLKDALSYPERVALLEALWDLVLADDRLDPLEASLMRRLAGLLYVDDADSGRARQRVLAARSLE